MSSKFRRMEGDPEILDTKKEWLDYACCDCGLVHEIKIKILNKTKVELTFIRNNRATGQLRRHGFGYLQGNLKLRQELPARE